MKHTGKRTMCLLLTLAFLLGLVPAVETTARADYINYSNASTPVSDSRVIQGGNESNFTETMPIASIYLDEDIVNTNLYTKDSSVVTYELLADSTEHPGMKVVDTGADYGKLYFDFKAGESISFTAGSNYKLFEGDVIRYTIKDAAEWFNEAADSYEKADVILTFSNIFVSLQNNLTQTNYNKISRLYLLDTNRIFPCFEGTDIKTGNNHRAGVKMDINVKIIDKSGEPVPGTFYFPVVDIDVSRSTLASFRNFYESAENNNYSEQVELVDNYYGQIWIPGADYDSSAPADANSNMPYLSNVGTRDGNVFIYPETTYSKVGGSRDNDFYTGFITLADNTAGGINYRSWSTAAGTDGVESYCLAAKGKIVNHRLALSTADGGSIATTDTGNHDGSLLGGALLEPGTVNKPRQLSAASGQTVTMTMTPTPGYKLKNVYVSSNSSDVLDKYNRGISSAVPESELTPLGGGSYTYTFADINDDKSVHVVWEPTVLSIKKAIEPTGYELSDTFTFKMKVWDPAPKTSVYKVSAWTTENKDSYSFTMVDTPADGVEYLLYDDQSSAFIGWDKDSGTWLRQPQNYSYETTSFDASPAYVWKLDSGRLFNTGADDYIEYEGDTAPKFCTFSTRTVQEKVYFDFTGEQGYTPISGENGIFTVTLPEGDTPDVASIIPAGYDFEIVDVTPAPYDIVTALDDVGIETVDGEDDTYTFTLKDGETKKLSGVIPAGWSYEITEVTSPKLGTENGWEFVSASSNASVADFDGDESVVVTNKRNRQDAEYKVLHYLEKLQDNEWDLGSSSTNTAPIGDTVSSGSLSFEGFTLTPEKTDEQAQADGNTFTDGTPAIVEGTVADDDSLELKFYYKRNTYKVTYMFESPTPAGVSSLVPVEKEYKYGETVGIDTTPISAPGYSFNGWQNRTVSVTNNSFTMPASDVVIVGSFTPLKDASEYTVSHYVEKADGSGEFELREMNTIYGTAGETATGEANSYEGVTFDPGNAGNVLTGTIDGLGGPELKLYYVRNRHNVTYNYEGIVPAGAPAKPADEEHLYGENVAVSAADQTVPGYTFSGWKLPEGSELTVSGDSFDMPDSDVTFVGRYTPNTDTAYKVEHYVAKPDGSGYELMETEDLTGTTGAQVSGAAKNYTGLTYDPTNAESILSGTVAGDGSLVLRLYYDRNEWPVTYRYDTDTVPEGVGTPPAASNHVYGETVQVEPEPATPQGYSFSGWNIAGQPAGTEFEMPNAAVVLVGSFTPNTDTVYRVSHYLENLEGTDFDLPAENTFERSGVTDTAVTAGVSSELTYGFTIDWEETERRAIADGLTVTTDASGAKVVSGNIDGDGTQELKLYYRRNTFTVNYEYEGHVPTTADPAPASKTYKYGETVIVEPNADEPTGYTFGGWSSELMNITTTDVDFTMPNSDVTLVGSFEPIKDGMTLTVRHYLRSADGEVYELPTDHEHPHEYIRNGTAQETAKAVPQSHLGYTINWDKTKEEAEAAGNALTLNASGEPDGVSGIIADDGSLVLALYYDPIEYTVSYHYLNEAPAGADPAPADKDYAFGEEVDLEAYPHVPAGYSFSGWRAVEGSAFDVGSGSFTMPDHNVELVGSFLPNDGTTYKVTHYLEKPDGSGYTVGASYTRTGTTDTEVYAVPNTFAGYTYDEDADNVTRGIVAGNNSLELVLFYKPKEFEVEYVYDDTAPANAPELPETETYRYGDKVTLAPEVEAPEGYTFAGWQVVSVPLGDGADSFSMPANKVTVVGKFVPKSNIPYKITHYVEKPDGSGYDVIETFESTGSSGDTATAAPRAYLGLSYDADNANNLTSEEIAGDGSTELKLYYKRNTYKVTYVYEGAVPNGSPAVPVDENEYKYGETVPIAPPVEAPDGYHFGGWQTRDVSMTGNSFTMPARDTVLVGSFLPSDGKRFTVTHYLQSPDGTEYVIGDSYVRLGRMGETAEAVPQAFYGFTFDDSDPRNLLSGTIDGDGGPELKLYYKRNTYDVVYRYEGLVPSGAPAAPGTESYPFGAEVSVQPDVKAPAGYVFTGWRVAPGSPVTVSDGTFSMPRVQVELVGSFAPGHTDDPEELIVVTFDAASGTMILPDGTVKTVDVTADGTAPVNPGAVPELENYTFKGWKRPGDDKIYTIEEIEAMVFTESVTFTAVYESKPTVDPDPATGGSGQSKPGIKPGADTPVTPAPTPGKLDSDNHFAYIIGYPEGDVRPGGSITRAEVATIFFRLLTEEVRSANFRSDNSFSDVARGMWFNNAVSTMETLGIVTGYADGTFRPNNTITRAEFAAIAARFDERAATTTPSFSDVAGHWAEAEIAKAAENGWINGYPDGTFRPDQAITRAEAMTLVNRVLNRDPADVSDLRPDMICWPDNADETAWYYLAVQEATNSHDYERNTKPTEKWTVFCQPRDWAALEY